MTVTKTEVRLKNRIKRLRSEMGSAERNLKNEFYRQVAEELLRSEERPWKVSVQTVRAGIRWLQSEQDQSAWVSQFGIFRTVGPYKVNVMPERRGEAIVVFEVEPDHLRPVGVGHEPRMTEVEVQRLRQIVEKSAMVDEQWNGPGCTSVSFRIVDAMGQGVERAYLNYRDHPHSKRNNRIRVPKGWD